MAREKDYDSTLARIAGNIAAGLVAAERQPVEVGHGSLPRICSTAMAMATTIVDLCRAEQRQQAEFEQQQQRLGTNAR